MCCQGVSVLNRTSFTVIHDFNSLEHNTLFNKVNKLLYPTILLNVYFYLHFPDSGAHYRV